LRLCCYSPHVTSSLTGGWVCRLQLLLGLASTVIPRSAYYGPHDHILLSQIRDFPNWRSRSHYLRPILRLSSNIRLLPKRFLLPFRISG
jgi:hypothetical protein